VYLSQATDLMHAGWYLISGLPLAALLAVAQTSSG
jgi:hypothetical protein